VKCKDCKYLHIRAPLGFCSYWKSDVGQIKCIIKKCSFYKKKDLSPTPAAKPGRREGM